MSQLIRFLLVGVCNTAVGLGCTFLATWLFGIDYRIANAIGYAAGFGLSFFLNRTWTFQHRGRWWISFARWVAVAAVAYGLNFLTIVVLYERTGLGPYYVQIAGNVVYTLAAFIGARFFAFRRRRSDLAMEPT